MRGFREWLITWNTTRSVRMAFELIGAGVIIAAYSAYGYLAAFAVAAAVGVLLGLAGVRRVRRT
jgi:hypothetical protein